MGPGTLPAKRVATLARWAQTASNQALAQSAPERRYPALLAFGAERLAEVTDELVDLFDKLLADTNAKARRRLGEYQKSVAGAANDKMLLLAQIARLLLDPDLPDEERLGALFDAVPKDRLAAALADCERIARPAVRGDPGPGGGAPGASSVFPGGSFGPGQHAPVSAIVSVARLPDAGNEVDAAVAAGLLTEDASALELAFAHPLYRAAIYGISARQAGANCTRAGEVVASRARLAHRPAASLGPDEALAGELEASAQAAATAAGDAGASAWALEQAAALSPAAQGRESRLLDAAVVLLNAADTSAAALVLASCQVTSARRDAITRLLGCPPDRPARRVACSPRGRPRTRGPRVKPERVPRHPWPTGWSCLAAQTRR